MSDTEEKPGFFHSVNWKVTKEGCWRNNPIFCQILGICSALAVTNRLSNALVMSAALTFCLCGTNVIISLLRTQIPKRIRMIAEVAVIATFVIAIDLFLKAYWFDMSKALGPYVGLIITNCIIMGRCEAFAMTNPPLRSFWDGIGNGLGYTFVLGTIGLFRELLGAGTILGLKVMPKAYPQCQLMIVASGAFIMMGILIWIMRAISPLPEERR